MHNTHGVFASFLDVVPVGRDPFRIFFLCLDLKLADRRVEDPRSPVDLQGGAFSGRADRLEHRLSVLANVDLVLFGRDDDLLAGVWDVFRLLLDTLHLVLQRIHLGCLSRSGLPQVSGAVAVSLSDQFVDHREAVEPAGIASVDPLAGDCERCESERQNQQRPGT